MRLPGLRPGVGLVRPEGSGLEAAKVARVVGMSSSVLFDQSNPRNPINRRISLILMTKQAEEAALQSDRPAGQFGGNDTAAQAPAGAAANPAAAAAAIEGSVKGG